MPVDIIHPHIDVTKDPKQQSIPSGGTAHFTIVVTNDGDTPLNTVTITDPNSPDCNRTSAETAALILTQTRARTAARPGRVVHVRLQPDERDELVHERRDGVRHGQASTQVCDTDEVPNQIPDCPEPDTLQLDHGLGHHDGAGSQAEGHGDDQRADRNPGRNADVVTVQGPGCLAANQVDLNGSDPGKDLTADVTQNGNYTVTAADFLSVLLGSSNTAGTYNWITSYSGDPASNNAAIAGTCGTENFSITNG